MGVTFAAIISFSVTTSAQDSKKSKTEDPFWKPSKVEGKLTSNVKEREGRFPNWPDRDPDFVVVITGETHSYLQKCGCSDPQKGGLERRYNLLDSLKSRGWELVPIDLGDVAAQSKLREQGLLKYRVAMESMKAMGYRVSSIGIEEFRYSLFDTLSQFSLNSSEPRILSANVEFKDDLAPLKSTFMKNWEILPTKSGVSLGVVGSIGKSLYPEIEKLDRTVAFAPDGELVVRQALDEMNREKSKPNLNILLYQASQKRLEGQSEIVALQSARVVAEKLPEFKIIVTVTDQTEAPSQPLVQGDSWIIQVGQKGQHVGLVGVFKQPDGKFDLHYHRVTLTPEWETPKEGVASHPILKRLQDYSDTVKADNFLKKSPKFPHPSHAKYPNLKYIGSEACKACHQQEFGIWAASKHAHAYKALEVIASNPSGRNFDPECVRCHTIGFDYNTGFDGTPERLHLKNVGCESCHGPGNLHAEAEAKRDPLKDQYLPMLSPWKEPTEKNVHLPTAETLVKLQDLNSSTDRLKLMTAEQEQYLQRVDKVCFQCHDTENDPKFRFEQYMPKIEHFHAVKKLGVPAKR
jgi:hypothetical protein